MCQVFALCVIKSSQLGFNVHVQSKLSYQAPVVGTQSSFQVRCG